jgi:hypothetical protein
VREQEAGASTGGITPPPTPSWVLNLLGASPGNAEQVRGEGV